MKGSKRGVRLWAGGLLALVFFVLLSWGLRRGNDWTLLEKVLVEMTAPLQAAFSWIGQKTKGLWTGYFYLVGTRQENLSLRQQNEELKRELHIQHELLFSCERLEELHEFKRSLSHQTIIARVTGVDPTGLFKSIIINKGGSDGLDLDMAVISLRGVVGRIVSISFNYSKVLLITDQNSAVDCFIQRSRERGMVKGVAEGLCRLDYVPVTGDVVKDDIVITSGLEGIYPKGIPIGRVSAVRESTGGLFKDIEVEPYVDFNRIEEVLVVLGGEQK